MADFIIIGAAKAGTTSLYKKLSMHPDVFMTTPKEPEFFARDDIYSKGGDWYRALFTSAEEGQITGEASTLYSLTNYFPETVSRMYNLAPEAKIIFVLREPVARAYSYYTQILKNYQNSTRDFSVNRTFEECLFPNDHPKRSNRNKFFAPHDSHLTDSPETFTSGGLYMTIIKDYLEFYPRENLLLIRFEELINDWDSVMSKVCKFLEIDSSLLPNNEIVRENVSSEHFVKIDREAYKQSVISKLKSNTFIVKVTSLIPRTLRKSLLNWYFDLVKNNTQTQRPKKMKKTTELYLKKLYRKEIDELETYWGKNLDSWK